MWGSFVELVRLVVLAAAHLCNGSIGGGIFDVSLIVRIALLPLTLRVARQARDRQARIAAIEPQLASLRRRFADDPARLFAETRALHAAHGVRMLTPAGMASLLVQTPLLGALYAAVRGGLGARVRFLWIADLAASNGPLLGVVALVTGAVIAASTPASRGASAGAVIPIFVGIVGTLAFLWSASSAVVLSVGAGSLVSGLQAWILARDARRANVAA